MSFYTSGIHSRQLNATSNSDNFRTEFKFPVSEQEIYLTDIRLCNIGIVAAGTHAINSLTGLSSLIKNITLYDGNVVLDQILNLDLYSGFKSGYNSTNNDSIDKNHFLSKNNLGLVTLGGGNDITTQMILLNGVNQTTATSATTPKNWMSLKDTLAFLDESMYLPTSIFKGLRLVVEYSTSLTDILPNTQPGASLTLTPFLVVNQLVNPQAEKIAMKSYNGVVYRPMEHSVVTVPKITPTAGDPNPKQDITFTINSYNNKTVNRLIMIKQPQRASPSTSYGRLCSEAQYRERTQVSVNGANLLPQNGLTTENSAKAMLYDLWGDCVDIAGSAWIADPRAVQNAAQILGKLDYRSVMIENFVDQFQLSFGRDGQYNGSAADQTALQPNQALRLNLFAEVNKLLAVNPDGTYSIRYV